MIKLYYNPFSRATRVRWLLEEIGEPYELVRVDLDQENPELEKVHPLGKVPAIEDGALKLFESAAILMHLADKYPAKGFAPAVGTAERAEYYKWFFFGMTELEPQIVEEYVQTQVYEEKDRSKKNLDDARGFYKDAAGVLEKHLAGREFIVGGTFSAADVLMCSMLAWGKMMGLLDPYPNLQKYVKGLGSRPANKKSRAD